MAMCTLGKPYHLKCHTLLVFLELLAVGTQTSLTADQGIQVASRAQHQCSPTSLQEQGSPPAPSLSCCAVNQGSGRKLLTLQFFMCSQSKRVSTQDVCCSFKQNAGLHYCSLWSQTQITAVPYGVRAVWTGWKDPLLFHQPYSQRLWVQLSYHSLTVH